MVLLAFALGCGGRIDPDGFGNPPASSGGGQSGTSSGGSGGRSGSGSGGSSGCGAPSCQPGGPGMTNCGANGDDCCCTSLEVAGGMYYRSYAYGDTSSYADPATVSGFRLDKYLVTVGRFRQFVNAWNGGWLPSAGSGKHTHLNRGLGLANSGRTGTYETGWIASDDSNIAPTNVNLACTSYPYVTWTPSPRSQESLPINCVTWQEAYAFCIWDGGFLPSEAESEYAAAGGSQQREYPWGTVDPGIGNQYAIYGDYYTGDSTDIAPVGTATLGAGLWGQLDLAGDVFEWNLDWFTNNFVDPCTDCAYLTATSSGWVVIGGCYSTMSVDFSPSRSPSATYSRSDGFGFRCARAP
jgi:formylglycine-generating enzyme